jgi:hypothetical protein
MVGGILVFDRAERDDVVNVQMPADAASAAFVPVALQDPAAYRIPIWAALINLVTVLKVRVVLPDPVNVAASARAIFAGSLGS